MNGFFYNVIYFFISDREMQAIKERQDLEIITQRATIQELQNRIDILDSALTNAQANVVRLEKEVSSINTL